MFPEHCLLWVPYASIKPSIIHLLLPNNEIYWYPLPLNHFFKFGKTVLSVYWIGWIWRMREQCVHSSLEEKHFPPCQMRSVCLRIIVGSIHYIGLLFVKAFSSFLKVADVDYMGASQKNRSLKLWLTDDWSILSYGSPSEIHSSDCLLVSCVFWWTTPNSFEIITWLYL